MKKLSVSRIYIRSHLMILMMSGLSAIIIITLSVVKTYADSQKIANEQYMMAITKLLAAAVEQKIQVVRSALEVLANTQAVKDHQFDQLYNQSLETGRLHGGIIVFQDLHHHIFNTRFPMGASMFTPTKWGTVSIETGKWSASNLFVAPATGKPTFIVSVPVLEDGVAKYALSLSMDPTLLSEVLIAQTFPTGWRASVIDRAGVIMARNVGGQQFLGQIAPPDYLAVALTQSEGHLESKTVDGLEVLTAFSRMSTGWVVGLGVDFKVLDAPLRSSLVKLAMGGLAVLLITGAGALWWGGRLAATTVEMASMAEALGRGESLPAYHAAAYREAGLVILAQRAASVLLAKRAADRDASAAESRQLAETLQQVVVERTKALVERDLLLREVYHRVKNNLQVVDGLLLMQAVKIADPEAKEALNGLRSRVFALGLVHQQLMESSDLKTFDIEPFLIELAENIMGSASDGRIQLKVDAFPLYVGLDFAVPLGLIVTEIITNSLKHAFPDGVGEISVTLRAADGAGLVLVVADNGRGQPHQSCKPAKVGSGSSIIKKLVAQLGGEMTVSRDAGTTIKIFMPLPESP